MFLEKNAKNVRSPFSVLAVLTLAITVLWSGASIANAQAPTTRLDDFVGDNRTDFTTLQFINDGPIRWRLTGNPASPAPNAAFKREFDFGLAGNATTTIDSVTVGDYVGDSKSDPTVYRSPNATFYVGNSPTGTGGITLNRAVPFGIPDEDIPGAQGDYDGDGKTDFTLVRQTPGGGPLTWYIMNSANNTVRSFVFGTTVGISGATVFPGADFTADGRDEIVYVTRNATGLLTYYIGDTNTGTGVITKSFGDYDLDVSLAPDDYTGDRKADFVAVRQTQGDTGVWYINNSATNETKATRFGFNDPSFMDYDFPVRGDFDGDGTHDICVWRDSNQTFYYISSSQTGVIGGQKSGNSGDFPLGSFGAY